MPVTLSSLFALNQCNRDLSQELIYLTENVRTCVENDWVEKVNCFMLLDNLRIVKLVLSFFSERFTIDVLLLGQFLQQILHCLFVTTVLQIVQLSIIEKIFRHTYKAYFCSYFIGINIFVQLFKQLNGLDYLFVIIKTCLERFINFQFVQ